MITVGIRNLRNSLSRYIDIVKKGERVLITDHNKIVAEIIPSELNTHNTELLKEYTQEQIKSGTIIAATSTIKLPSLSKNQSTDEELIKKIYEETRKERI
jgi:prevent-host-death family protein